MVTQNLLVSPVFINSPLSLFTHCFFRTFVLLFRFSQFHFRLKDLHVNLQLISTIQHIISPLHFELLQINFNFLQCQASSLIFIHLTSKYPIDCPSGLFLPIGLSPFIISLNFDLLIHSFSI